MTEVMDNVEKEEFSEFSKKAYQSLKDKLNNHPKVVSHEKKIEKLNKMKDLFKQISSLKDEPVTEPEVTPEPEPEAIPEPEPEPEVTPEPEPEEKQ